MPSGRLFKTLRLWEVPFPPLPISREHKTKTKEPAPEKLPKSRKSG